MEDRLVLAGIGVGEEEDLRRDRKRVARETFVVMKQTPGVTCDKAV